MKGWPLRVVAFLVGKLLICILLSVYISATETWPNGRYGDGDLIRRGLPYHKTI
jgi:hypothetical protein